MAKRKDIFDTLSNEILDSDIFKDVFKGIAPPITNVKNFPACAVVITKENKDFMNMSCNDLEVEMDVSLFIYNYHYKGDYSDILGDLIDQTQDVLRNSTDLQKLTISVLPAEIYNDGGILYPYAMGEIKLKIKYIEN